MDEIIFLNCLQNIIEERNENRKFYLTNIETPTIKMETSLDSLGLSSINLMEIIVLIESELGIEFEINRNYSIVEDLFADIRL